MSSAEFVDGGYRTVEAGRSRRSGESRVEERARRSSPGAWDEDLGVFGGDEWELPGFGESGPRCGEWVPEAVCGTCGHLDLTNHTCGRRTCPECWGIWAKGAAVRATVRIQAFRYTQPADYRRQVAHAVLSPPDGEITNEREFFEGRREAAEKASEKGWRGFTVIGHPFRATDEGKARYRAEVPRDPDGEPVYGFWVWWRNDVDELERDELLYWSPHYHVIGATGRDMDGAEESDEWVYSFFRSLTSFEGTRDTESHADMYGTFRYLLSHTGWPSGSSRQAVTWYGCLSNSVFVEEAGEDWQYEKPSEGILSALEREVEEIAGPVEDDDRSDSGAEIRDEGVCPCDGCDGRLIHVFDVEAYLRQVNPPPEVADVMVTARDWRLGRIEPPPGLRRPQSEEGAREAYQALRE